MPSPQTCAYCPYQFSRLLNACPHCGRPGLFPNVQLASDPAEQGVLEGRYAAVLKAAESSGGTGTIDRFKAAIDKSVAVLGVPLQEATRLAQSDSEVKATFYGLADTRVPPANAPEGMDWNTLRTLVDTAVFGDANKKEVRFAALSIDGTGLTSYGACTLVCDTGMIAHRASMFERNTCQFFVDSELQFGKPVPPGHRSTWAERVKLCLAKVGERLKEAMTDADFQNLVMTKGIKTDDDEVVEVHIYGPLTFRTLRDVVVRTSKKRRTVAQELKDRLDDLKIPCKVQVV